MLWLGSNLEKTCGRKQRSEAVINGRTAKGGNPQFGRPGPKKLIENKVEKPGQRVPAEWPSQAKLGKKWGPTAWKK